MKIFLLATVAALLPGAALAACGCTVGETCCGDQVQGDTVCCVDEATICFNRTGSYPSRCCPHWTIGCASGSVGCCDPAHPWQRNMVASEASIPAATTTTTTTTTLPDTIYSMFVTGAFTPALHVHIFDATGVEQHSIAVTGPAVDWYKKYDGESTRLFVFSEATATFYYLDTLIVNNKTAAVQRISVDAKTGVSKVDTLSLAGKLPGDVRWTMYPTSFAFDATAGKLIFSVANEAGDESVVHAVAEGTVTTERLCTLARSAQESDASFYAGYITEADNGVLSRVGYQFETNATGPGTLRTQCSTGAGHPEWTPLDASTIPNKAGMYYSLNERRDVAGYVSLAPMAAGFILVSWDPRNTTVVPEVLASFPKTFPPEIILVGNLGYIATGVTKSGFYGMVVTLESGGEKWAAATYDFATKEHAVNVLKPDFLHAASAGLSGFGVSSV